MKIPGCFLCQNRYNEEERVPLLLQCGHCFCKECLSRMFAASPDTNLSCPRCRHVSSVGNSVQALRKNYGVLALIQSSSAVSSAFDCDFTDDEQDNEDGLLNPVEEDDDAHRLRRCTHGSHTSSSSCGPVIELASHPELRLVKRIGEGPRAGVEMWSAVLSGGPGRCRHDVAAKKVVTGEDTDLVWVQNRLDKLRRASMWCRNVCTFHGATKMEGSLCLIIDRCYGSVQSEMQRNEGRLTLEQILRFCALSCSFIACVT